jgi:large repetitive protein
MIPLRCARKLYVLMGLLSLLEGCSNGRGSLDGPETPGAQAGFTIGATVSGLVGSGLVLRNNGGNDLAVSTDGSVAFTTSLADGAAYDVTVASQPAAPEQSCNVANGSGRVAGANITNITVTCVTTGTGSFGISGTVTGLSGTGLVLQNNGGDDLPLFEDGTFDFTTLLASGAAYKVTVATQPAGQSCSVANGAGTIGGTDITNVTVTCATGAFTIGGTVTGLTGSGLVIQNNGGDDLSIPTGSSTFAFPVPVANGAPYSVVVKSQPAGQNCAVQKPSGVVRDANVTNVVVSCSNLFTIGGSVSGLGAGALLILQNNGDDLEIRTDGGFAFETPVPSGTSYSILVTTQPTTPSQACTVRNGSGTVGSTNVTNVQVTCKNNSFMIGGTVKGLDGSGLVLQNNGRDDLAIASNGSFNFATQQASGSGYAVSVKTQPSNPSQACTVSSGSGTVGSGNVRSVRVSCATSTFSVSGTVSGLQGQNLTLRNNGGDTTEVQSNGAFQFTQPVASGAAYNVTVATQPSNPTQACTVTGGTGTIGSANVTNVAVSCSTSQFMVGGRVRGLTGSGLILRNNGADDLAVNSDGNFQFATAVFSGAAYSVTVAAQPTGPTQECTVSQASGTVGGGNVTSVEVECVTIGFTVGGSVSGLSGSGLVLQNNGGDNLAIAASGVFSFANSITSGTPYNVSVASQPTNPSQTCTVTAGSGTVTNGNITNVSVSCVTNNFTIGGTVTGLLSFGLVLQNTGGELLNVGFNGPFTFSTPLPSGTAYSVTVAAPPIFPSQTCTVTNATGTLGADNVTNVSVTCN